ncbi:MAG: 3-dehydroquinate synthase [Elusimicrobium sp.]|jgi:3-dehydroquinate synthase|nr:3-dehydroquinate synthase [Elusimicrobium sp.]
MNVKTLKLDSYEIIIGAGILGRLKTFCAGKNYSSTFILTDKTLYKLYAGALKKVLPSARFIVIPSGEKHKNLKTLENIWKTLFKYGADRKSVLINFGGGVIGDMGGFAAGVYMRGMDFIQVPTTLLAQVDASVGGKTAVDLNGAKNIIGAFIRPSMVLIDVTTLNTLPRRQLRAGWAEILKHGLIKDKKYFERAESMSLTDLIYKSCQIKANFVKIDEREKGPRKTLNLGHTVGHAVETLSFKTKNPLLHGEAVALGIIVESRLSVLNETLTEKEFQEIRAVFAKRGFALKCKNIKKKDILKLILKDKKNYGKKIKWTLLNSIGSAIYDAECAPQNISAAVDEIL